MTKADLEKICNVAIEIATKATASRGTAPKLDDLSDCVIGPVAAAIVAAALNQGPAECENLANTLLEE